MTIIVITGVSGWVILQELPGWQSISRVTVFHAVFYDSIALFIINKIVHHVSKLRGILT